MKNKQLNFKDDDGNIMYGYSQVSLDKNTEEIRNLKYAILAIGGGFLALSIYVLYQIMRFNILTNVVNAWAK